MASVIHSLWEKGDRGVAILPSSIPIDAPRVHERAHVGRRERRQRRAGHTAAGESHAVRNPGPAPLTPWTACQFDAAKKKFFAASGPGSDVSGGMLLLAGPNDYDVVEVDVDGAARKVLDFASNAARVGYGEAPTSIDSPTTYGLPSLRSAGFSAAAAAPAALKASNRTQFHVMRLPAI